MMLSASTAKVMISAPVQARLLPVLVGTERELEDHDRQAGDRRIQVECSRTGC